MMGFSQSGDSLTPDLKLCKVKSLEAILTIKVLSTGKVNDLMSAMLEPRRGSCSTPLVSSASSY